MIKQDDEGILIAKDELSALIKQDKQVLILDIRKKTEGSSIPGSVHVEVYDQLKANDANAFDGLDLPHDRPIITFCNSGNLSIVAAEILKKKGYAARSLKGGLNNWMNDGNE